MAVEKEKLMEFPLVSAVRVTVQRTRKLATRRLGEIGLFPGQEVVLLELLEHRNMNQAELAAALEIEPPSVTGLLTKLDAAGLVSRIPHGREKRITLTMAGRAAAAQTLEVYADIERALADGKTPEQVAAAATTLRCVSEAAARAIA